jgi:hypothetical protein
MDLPPAFAEDNPMHILRSTASARVRMAWPAAAGVLVVLLLAGCGGSHGATRKHPLFAISEADFRIVAPARLPAGDVTLRVHNRGPLSHELLIVRTGDGRLPMTTDRLRVDEEGLTDAPTGVLEPDGHPSIRLLSLHLSAGRYVLFCNLAGHYLGGMRRELVVR